MINTPNIWAQLRDLADNDVWELVGAGAPTSGTSGTAAGFAGPGSTYTDITNKIVYINTNTKASPTWTSATAASSGDFSAGTVLLPQGTTPAQTADGSIFWDTDDNLLSVGDGASRKAMVDLSSTQTLTNKTLTSPVMTAPSLGVATGTSLAVTGLLKSSSATAGVGYATGAGNAVAQGTNRTTGVTIDTPTGAITLFSAAGSATPASFTVTCAAVAATDVVIVNQKSGTDLYEIFVTAVGTGSFRITSFTTGGTTTEAPVFNYAVIKGVAA